MDKQLDSSPNQADASADMQRERLRSKLSHAAEILHEQGPIGTFIHTNPFHSLEHLHFEQAVAEAERLTGGHTYLPNDEFRRLYRTGRTKSLRRLRSETTESSIRTMCFASIFSMESTH